jgi:hypothetical protein
MSSANDPIHVQPCDAGDSDCFEFVAALEHGPKAAGYHRTYSCDICGWSEAPPKKVIRET